MIFLLLLLNMLLTNLLPVAILLQQGQVDFFYLISIGRSHVLYNKLLRTSVMIFLVLLFSFCLFYLFFVSV